MATNIPNFYNMKEAKQFFKYLWRYSSWKCWPPVVRPKIKYCWVICPYPLACPCLLLPPWFRKQAISLVATHTCCAQTRFFLTSVWAARSWLRTRTWEPGWRPQHWTGPRFGWRCWGQRHFHPRRCVFLTNRMEGRWRWWHSSFASPPSSSVELAPGSNFLRLAHRRWWLCHHPRKRFEQVCWPLRALLG